MNHWLLIAIAGMLLVLMTLREHLVIESGARGDITGAQSLRTGPGERPTFDGPEGRAWRSKVDAEMPADGRAETYLKAIQDFYDKVYAPLRTTNATASPKDTEVEEFLNTNTYPNVSNTALRQIILAGFSIDKTMSAAAREQKQVKFNPTEALQPRDGVDEVYGRNREGAYVPADSRLGNLPEGVYSMTNQTRPTRPGTWRSPSTSWSPQEFASVCDCPCAQNVL